MNDIFSLNQLPIGQKGRVYSLDSRGKERRRMLDLGLVHGTTVEALQKALPATQSLILSVGL